MDKFRLWHDVSMSGLTLAEYYSIHNYIRYMTLADFKQAVYESERNWSSVMDKNGRLWYEVESSGLSIAEYYTAHGILEVCDYPEFRQRVLDSRKACPEWMHRKHTIIEDVKAWLLNQGLD